MLDGDCWGEESDGDDGGYKVTRLLMRRFEVATSIAQYIVLE